MASDNSNSPSTIRVPFQNLPGQGFDPQVPNLHPLDRTYEIMRQLEAQKVQDTANSLGSLTNVSDAVDSSPVDGQVLSYVAAATQWEAVTIGSGTTTIADLEANRPAGVEGDLFLPTDGYQIERKGASAWAPWGPIWPFTPPNNGDFSWVNQDTATVTTSRGGIYLEHAAAGSATNANLRVKTAPATPYTITTYCRLNIMFARQFLQAGLLFRESSTGKFVSTHYQVGFIYTSKWTSATVETADYNQTDGLAAMPDWWQISDDGTNLIFRVSRDGYHWIEYFRKSRTDWMAGGPNQVGFFVNAENIPAAQQPCGLLLLHWVES